MSQNNKNNNPHRNTGLNMHNEMTKQAGIEDLIGQTDTDTSTSSSNTQVFEHNDPFVLELHELTRDELPDNPLPEVKTRRLLKKKKRSQLPANQSGSSLPSSSQSESSSVAPVSSDATKEEFYDAHESYHALSENQTSSAVASAAVAQVLSEHGNEPKLHRPAQEPTTPTQSTREPSTTITKPATPPE